MGAPRPLTVTGISRRGSFEIYAILAVMKFPRSTYLLRNPPLDLQLLASMLYYESGILRYMVQKLRNGSCLNPFLT